MLCSAKTKKNDIYTHSDTDDASVILLCSMYFFNLTTKNCINFHSITAKGCPKLDIRFSLFSRQQTGQPFKRIQEVYFVLFRLGNQGIQRENRFLINFI